jgi:hypothetical protein
MVKIRPYILDIVVGVIFILLPGFRGYANWQIYESGLLLLIYMYIVYLHYKKYDLNAQWSRHVEFDYEDASSTLGTGSCSPLAFGRK